MCFKCVLESLPFLRSLATPPKPMILNLRHYNIISNQLKMVTYFKIVLTSQCKGVIKKIPTWYESDKSKKLRARLEIFLKWLKASLLKMILNKSLIK